MAHGEAQPVPPQPPAPPPSIQAALHFVSLCMQFCQGPYNEESWKSSGNELSESQRAAEQEALELLSRYFREADPTRELGGSHRRGRGPDSGTIKRVKSPRG